MNGVSHFVILLSLICHLFVSSKPVAEWVTDFQPIEKKLKDLVNVAKESEIKFLWKPQEMDSCNDYQCIKGGLKKLKLPCIENDENTHNICRVLIRLEKNVINQTTLCEKPQSQRQFLEHIKSVLQMSER